MNDADTSRFGTSGSLSISANAAKLQPATYAWYLTPPQIPTEGKLEIRSRFEYGSECFVYGNDLVSKPGQPKQIPDGSSKSICSARSTWIS